MTDVYDRAQQLDEAEREACVAQQRAKRGMVACGACHNCGEPLQAGLLFCPGVECRDDYEKEQLMKRIQGRG